MLDAKLGKSLRDYRLDVEFSVKPGEILIFMGRNGSGKSTTFNLISGLLLPDSGSIRISGSTLFDIEQGVDLPVEERRIAYVFQNTAIFPHLTVYENIAYGLRCRAIPRKSEESIVKSWLIKMEIAEIANVRAGALSGGQRQRVALARALAIDPQLLLLDEPFTGLDAGTILSVKRLIREIVQEKQIPCILVTHRISDAIDLGSRICLFHDGRIICTGNPDEIKTIYQSDFPDCSCISTDIHVSQTIR